VEVEWLEGVGGNPGVWWGGETTLKLADLRLRSAESMPLSWEKSDTLCFI
jgi:hypothetical protein